MNLLVSVSGGGVSICRETKGQLSGADFVADNVPGQTLPKLIRKYWGHPNTIVVQDVEFGTGYHRVTTHCSAGGHGWGYRLHQVLTQEESIEANNEAVRQTKAGEPVTAKSGLEIAFERVEKHR